MKKIYKFSSEDTLTGDRKYFHFPTFKEPIKIAINPKDIQKGLDKVGLNCSDASIENIETAYKKVKDAVPTKGIKYLASNIPEKAEDFEYTLDPENEYVGQMGFLMSNIDLIEKHSVYAIAYNHEETSFNSSTLGAITSAFTAAASIIGDISSGHADPEQVSAGIGDTLSSLSETTSKNYEKKKSEVVFLSSKPDDNGRSKSIVGIKYKYKFCVEDYADKKEETHKSSSEIEQWNMVFTSVDVFKEVFKYVLELKNKTK